MNNNHQTRKIMATIDDLTIGELRQMLNMFSDDVMIFKDIHFEGPQEESIEELLIRWRDALRLQAGLVKSTLEE